VFVLGDELLDSGLPRDGKIRDSLSVQVPAWAVRSGAVADVARRVVDTLPATVAALESSDAALLLTTGGTARGPVDHLHAALDEIGAELVVDSVAVRPGHPMLLAALPGNRFLIGLPGNPMAAAAAFCTLALPVLAGWSGRDLDALSVGRLTTGVAAPATEHRLIPARLRSGSVEPLPHQGSAMLRGLAAATDFAVSPPGGAQPGMEIELLPLPWR
jgi:molybdopterin molybdotransferase